MDDIEELIRKCKMFGIGRLHPESTYHDIHLLYYGILFRLKHNMSKNEVVVGVYIGEAPDTVHTDYNIECELDDRWLHVWYKNKLGSGWKNEGPWVDVIESKVQEMKILVGVEEEKRINNQKARVLRIKQKHEERFNILKRNWKL